MRSSTSCIAVPPLVRDPWVVPVRCVIVDDNEDFLASAARLLESQGATVVGVATGYAQGLRLVAELAPEIALIDVDLGEEDGIALARELQASAPTTRSVLISAHELDDLDLAEEGADFVFLPKAELGADALAGLR
jgi:two-component system, NarL family, nitrate/nitrite response regulator NarL